MATPTTVHSKNTGLVRGLGFWSATAIVVGDTIGTGVFLVASDMARTVGSASLVLTSWILGLVIVLFGAFFFWITLTGVRSWTDVLKGAGCVFLMLLARVAIDASVYDISLIEALKGRTSLTWLAYGSAAGLALGVVVNLFRRKLTWAGGEEGPTDSAPFTVESEAPEHAIKIDRA